MSSFNSEPKEVPIFYETEKNNFFHWLNKNELCILNKI